MILAPSFFRLVTSRDSRDFDFLKVEHCVACTRKYPYPVHQNHSFIARLQTSSVVCLTVEVPKLRDAAWICCLPGCDAGSARAVHRLSTRRTTFVVTSSRSPSSTTCEALLFMAVKFSPSDQCGSHAHGRRFVFDPEACSPGVVVTGIRALACGWGVVSFTRIISALYTRDTRQQVSHMTLLCLGVEPYTLITRHHTACWT